MHNKGYRWFVLAVLFLAEIPRDIVATFVHSYLDFFSSKKGGKKEEKRNLDETQTRVKKVPLFAQLFRMNFVPEMRRPSCIFHNWKSLIKGIDKKKYLLYT